MAKTVLLTYAQTDEPLSGITVKRTSSLLNLTHATGPKDASEAVNSGRNVKTCYFSQVTYTYL